jgi:hypothetical protein
MSESGSTGLPNTAGAAPEIQDCGAPRRGHLKYRHGIPGEVRKEIIRCARELNRSYRGRFISDQTLKDRAARLLRSLLPPKPRRRGRPGRPDVTQAIRLLELFKRHYPDEKPAEHWARLYPLVIQGYGGMNSVEQRDARERLRERVRWRQRQCSRASTTRSC